MSSSELAGVRRARSKLCRPAAVLPLLVVLATIVPGGVATAGNADDKCGGLAGVEAWYGSVSFVVATDDRYAPQGANGGALYHVYKWNGGGSVELQPMYEDDERRPATWRGEEQELDLKVNDVDGIDEGAAGKMFTVITSGAQVDNRNYASLGLNCERGTYSVVAGFGDVRAKKKIELPPALKKFCGKAPGAQGDGAAAAQMLCALVEAKQKEAEKDEGTLSIILRADDVKLDPKTKTLSGSRKVESNHSLFNGKPLEGQLVWSLTPAKELPVDAVMVPPKGYDRWLPEGGPDQNTPGGQVVVEVKLERRGKPDEPPGVTAQFEVELVDVSKLPGLCNNAPLSGASQEPDLKLEQPKNLDLKVEPDGQKGKSKEGLSSLTVNISAFDYGAHGQLKVRAKLSSGHTVTAYVKAHPGTTLLHVPKDENQNDVADGWERERGVYERSLDASSDEDETPAGQRRRGDGYTLFEEYRGFKTPSGYVRTWPTRKDLFVYDPDGLVRTHYEPENPAGLTLHYVDPTTMRFGGVAKSPDNRWMNFNAGGEHTYARQYALFVKLWSGDVAGQASATTLDAPGSADDPYEVFAQPLKSFYVVKVSSQALVKALSGVSPTFRQNIYAMQFKTLVIHEIGHALGIHHHFAVPATGEAPPLDPQGKPVKETDDSVALGSFDCAMRYTSADEYTHPELLKPQFGYCKKGQTYRRPVSKPDEKGGTTYAWEALPAHDCFGQVDVKSDP